MPPITHEVQATTGSSADVTVTAPATVQAGDLLLAHVAFDGNNMPAVTSVPVGWMLVEAQADGTTVYGGWWWKRAETGDASTSWVFTGNGNSEQWITHCVRVTGHHPTMPVNAYNWATGSSSGPYISPAVTTTVDDCLVIYSLARDGGSHSHTPPVGCVEIFDGVSAASGGTAATKTQSTAGDTGSGEFGSATVEQWIAITLAIAPEPSDDTLIPMPLTTGAPVLGTPDLSGPGVSPAPVWETDVEEAAPLDAWTFSRNTTVTTAQAVSPTHSLALTPLPDESAYMRKSLPAVTDRVVIHMHARWEDVPSIDSVYLWYWQTSSGRSPGVHFELTTGVIEAQLEPGDDYISVGPVLVADHWYDIWIRIDLSGTTHTFEWIVDGVEQATIIRPDDTPDTFDASGFRPSIDRGGPTVYLDDIAIYNDPDAYPTTAANLTPVGIITGAPTLDSPALSQAHALAGDGLATAAPAVGAPAIGQSHALTADDAAALPPSLTAPALTQMHELAGNGVTAEPPALGAAAVEQTHVLTAAGPTSGAPVPGTPSLGAVALTAEDVALGAPVLPSPGLEQTHVLAAASVALGAPVLSAPGVSQTHALGAEEVLLGGPGLGAPSLGSVATLAADNLVLGAPVVEATVLSQTHELAGDDVATGPPDPGTAGIGQAHELGDGSLVLGTPLPGNPVLDQVHVLVAMPLATAAPVPGRPLLVQTHELITAGIVAGVPVPGLPHFRVPTAVLFSARMPGMAASARQPRVAFDVEEEI